MDFLKCEHFQIYYVYVCEIVDINKCETIFYLVS